MTLQNNILFEKPFDESFYKKVIGACALEADIELLPGGEQTEIGEKVRNDCCHWISLNLSSCECRNQKSDYNIEFLN